MIEKVRHIDHQPPAGAPASPVFMWLMFLTVWLLVLTCAAVVWAVAS